MVSNLERVTGFEPAWDFSVSLEGCCFRPLSHTRIKLWNYLVDLRQNCILCALVGMRTPTTFNISRIIYLQNSTRPRIQLQCSGEVFTPKLPSSRHVKFSSSFATRQCLTQPPLTLIGFILPTPTYATACVCGSPCPRRTGCISHKAHKIQLRK